MCMYCWCCYTSDLFIMLVTARLTGFEELLKLIQGFYISLSNKYNTRMQWCIYMCMCLGVNVHDTLKIQEEMEMWKMRDWEIQKSHPKNVSGMENER